jgi:hypothetical protein
MAKNEFKMKKDAGWKKMERLFASGENKAVYAKHIKRATQLNGKMAEALIRNEIKNEAFAKNAPLTSALKGGGKPLIGTSAGAQLFQSITSKAIDDESVFVGVLKTNSFYNVARSIHNGTVIAVTPAMRGLFFMLWLASTGQMSPSELSKRGQELYGQMSTGWLPLKASTKNIVIPPRPFIEQTINNAGLQKKSENNWKQALEAAFREVATNK